jgi:hypothetical protein
MGRKLHSIVIIDGDKEKSAQLWIETWGFATKAGLKPEMDYRWEDLKVFSIEGPEQLQKRVTVTRLLAIGLFAFAKKKASGESFLFVETKSSETLIYKFIKKSEPEVKALFAPYKNQLPNESPTTTSNDTDITQQVEKLAELYAKGALTAEEFSAMKAKLLN